MRAFDLSPLFRQTVGFDRLINNLAQSGGLEPAPNYPPYNIERTGEHAYRVTLAVAGFAREDLSIETRENALTIRGAQQPAQEEPGREFLHQGIAARAFERRFQLADHVVVTGAALENGLLACRPRARDSGGAEAASHRHRHAGSGRREDRRRQGRGSQGRVTRDEDGCLGGVPRGASFSRSSDRHPPPLAVDADRYNCVVASVGRPATPRR